MRYTLYASAILFATIAHVHFQGDGDDETGGS